MLTTRPETEAFALAKLEVMSVNELMAELEAMIMPVSLSLPTPGRDNSPESSSMVVALKKEVADLKLKNAELSAQRSYHPSLFLSCLVLFVYGPLFNVQCATLVIDMSSRLERGLAMYFLPSCLLTLTMYARWLCICSGSKGGASDSAMLKATQNMVTQLSTQLQQVHDRSGALFCLLLRCSTFPVLRQRFDTMPILPQWHRPICRLK